ncbi:23S rRNA (guanosine(2251)-2'-O)-methyltransferase RlmB [Lutimonas sp.]|uniref:23S rRNA (guanosine(2251)-2'-O)-methyltransferase RlmB n=1 Tax=Lutimonas sp. TaxID=1872403 RepID=UPI003D9B8636
MEKDTTKIFGLRAILEAIDAGKEIEKVYLQKEIQGSLAKALQHKINDNNISYSYVPIEKLNKLSKFQNHQGAVAKISSITYQDLDSVLEEIDLAAAPLFLLFDQISDVRNLGAMLRTAECTGVDTVILPSHGNAPINADAIKTSAGAAFKLSICKVNHILDAVYQLKAHGIQIVSVTEKTHTSIYDLDYAGPTAVIMGSEDKGISNSVLKNSDHKGKLPLLGDIESLNVSVACGATLYEIVRQRGLK